MSDSVENAKEAILDSVRRGYARIAVGGASCRGQGGSCCGAGSPEGLATALGYDETDLAEVPDGANMGLSCGNPTALAQLKPGETVLDLGSGGGFDVFIAARKVGPSGRAIGVDMTPEMLARARGNVAAYRKATGLANVEFRLGEIEHLPVADASVDAVISNCVINLSPDKPQVWREIARVLRPGGRAAVSDLALLAPLPAAVRKSAAALIGCVGGAAPVKDTEKMARAAGLVEVELDPRPSHLDAMMSGNAELRRATLARLPKGKRLGDYVVSLYVSARKPRQSGKPGRKPR